MTFEEWLGEMEGFSLRSERAFEDLAMTHENPSEHWKDVKEWLRAAYQIGLEEGLLGRDPIV